MKKLQGTGVALVTPFKKDKRIDFGALDRLVQHCIDGGVEYLVVLGTTGESATLNKDEKIAVLETVKESNEGRLPIVLGVGGNDTLEVERQMRDQDFEGIAAILSVSPYYNKPAQHGIIDHYSYLAYRAPRPIIMYNVPGRTGSNMTAQTTLTLAEHHNIAAVKEASGNLTQIMTILESKPKDFEVISGDDALTSLIVFAGGHGVISVVGQAFPEPFTNMVRAALSRKVKKANVDHYKLWPLTDLLFKEGNPAGVKMALHLQGIMEPHVRMPLAPASTGLKKSIESAMVAAGLK